MLAPSDPHANCIQITLGLAVFAESQLEAPEAENQLLPLTTQRLWVIKALTTPGDPGSGIRTPQDAF